jgi:hypothetical protein
MKLRIGRKNIRTLYVQLGDEPSDQDLPIGFAVDWHTAQALCTVANAPMLAPYTSPGDAQGRWEHLEEMARMANFIDGSPRPAGD